MNSQADRQLRHWQAEALNAWRTNDRRGIVAAATGTGKTIVGVDAIEEALRHDEKVFVVVPTNVLQLQWEKRLRTELRLSGKRLGLLGGTRADFDFSNDVVISVINSARVRLSGIVEHWNSMGERVILIIDECHWAGSENSRSLFTAPLAATLGLSATPERGDDGFDEVLEPGLGPVVFRYPLKKALDDGLVGPLQVVNVYFDLTPAERFEYQRILARVQAAVSGIAGVPAGISPTDPDLPRILGALGSEGSAAIRLLNEARRQLGDVTARTAVLRRLGESGVFFGRRSIVFNETIKQAEVSKSILDELGVTTVVDHSGLSGPQREQGFRRFSTGRADCLVAVRAMDEGIDVPDADLAVIVSGTLNPRQRIQRFGRVVRAKERTALAISLLAKDSAEELVGLRDESLVGRARVGQLRETSLLTETLGSMHKD
jgi:superfamily II DNA or RNA helicase